MTGLQLKDLGISNNQSADWQRIATVTQLTVTPFTLNLHKMQKPLL